MVVSLCGYDLGSVFTSGSDPSVSESELEVSTLVESEFGEKLSITRFFFIDEAFSGLTSFLVTEGDLSRYLSGTEVTPSL